MGSLVCILYENPQFIGVAQEASNFLHAPINPPKSEEFSYRLVLAEDGFFLEDRGGRHLKIDFIKDHLSYQRKGLRGKNELLAKALGFAKGNRRVLDLTAGLGVDSLFMVKLGFEVVALERSRLIYFLLQDAWKKVSELQNKVQFQNVDAYDYLSSSKDQGKFDAIYFDPMYPHKKKSALPKQEMVLFRELVGDDEDSSAVLAAALKWPVNRVVVKRPIGAPELTPGVHHSLEGKVVRYDVYMRSV